MKKINHTSNLSKIFKSLVAETFALAARESSTLEFKESFNWGSKDRYAKTMAAFANNRGGYLIFGVTNSPRIVAGLSSQNFEALDEADITAYLNGLFSPEIQYEKFSFGVVDNRTVGIIYTHSCEFRPVVPIKMDGIIREAEIYYRYNARNDKIKYPELKRLFDEVQERERANWMDLFQRVSKIGPANTGVLDIANGTIEGAKDHLLIDAALLPKLRFIKEGSFADGGKPVLKLVGDVKPVAIAGPYRGDTEVRLTSDPHAPTIREESILEQFPLTYTALVKRMGARYSDFKLGKRFHKLRGKLRKSSDLCKRRLLDPSNPHSSSKDFYSERIFEEFDKHYKKTQKD